MSILDKLVLMLNNNIGDIEVITKSDTLTVSSHLIRVTSEVFQKMFSGNFNDCKEKKMDFYEYDYDVVKVFFTYLYTQNIKYDKLSCSKIFQLLQLACIHCEKYLQNFTIDYISSSNETHLNLLQTMNKFNSIDDSIKLIIYNKIKDKILASSNGFISKVKEYFDLKNKQETQETQETKENLIILEKLINDLITHKSSKLITLKKLERAGETKKWFSVQNPTELIKCHELCKFFSTDKGLLWTNEPTLINDLKTINADVITNNDTEITIFIDKS